MYNDNKKQSTKKKLMLQRLAWTSSLKKIHISFVSNYYSCVIHVFTWITIMTLFLLSVSIMPLKYQELKMILGNFNSSWLTSEGFLRSISASLTKWSLYPKYIKWTFDVYNDNKKCRPTGEIVEILKNIVFWITPSFIQLTGFLILCYEIFQ